LVNLYYEVENLEVDEILWEWEWIWEVDEVDEMI